MPGLPAPAALALALAAGVAVELGVTALSGRAESWDAPIYWKAGYPGLIAASAALGWLAPQRPWRWALAAMLGQFGTMMLRKGEASLWPLGLVLSLVLALPGMAAAQLLAGWRLRRAGGGP
ncbi:MAG TPA: hypothetical protein VFD43_09685 [Planctomycetota bacterium]|nr:hypothetical protein [Planctomycetota bacterium]